MKSLERRDEGAALITAILLIMVISMLAVLMLGLTVAQVKPTLVAAKTSKTISAAETGVDATLSQLRAASRIEPISSSVVGDPRQLPCTVQGQVDGTAEYGYEVEVRYFSQDPAGTDAAWRAANAMACTSTGLIAPPSFALIRSVGVGPGVPGYEEALGDRTLETVYTFQVIDDNIEGGVIYDLGRSWCLEATSATAGATIRYREADTCYNPSGSAVNELALWTWQEDYRFHLSVSDMPGRVPLCITGRPSSNSSPVNATLQPCGTHGTSQTDQLFSWWDGARWKVQNESNTATIDSCLGTGKSSTAPGDGVLLKVGACANNESWGSFDPDPRLGAAAASYGTSQLVNYLEFGRCADVTQGNIDNNQMIVYPCKQDPSGSGGFNWNHKWFYDEPADNVGSTPTKIRVQPNSYYCLKSPSTEGGAVTFTNNCSDGATSWTRYADTGAWSTSYVFMDRNGRCLTLGDKWSGDQSRWSTMVVKQCSGQAADKWNAPAQGQTASLNNYRELDD